MAYFAFLVLLSSIFAPAAHALSCAKACQFSGTIGSMSPPTCTFVDKPASEQSCQVGIAIDYVTGAVNGAMNPKTPPAVPTFAAITAFSLAKEAVSVTVEYDCTDGDHCDMAFVADVLKSDWTAVRERGKNLRSYLTELLFDENDLRKNETCPSDTACSGKGFCQSVYQVWTDKPNPAYASHCANSTNEPMLDWMQEQDQSKTGVVLIYTCNKPSCATAESVANITKEILRDYTLPFNATIPPASTVAPTVTTTSLDTSGSTTSPSTTTTTSADTSGPTASPSTTTTTSADTSDPTVSQQTSTSTTTSADTSGPTSSQETSAMTSVPGKAHILSMDEVVQLASILASFLFFYLS